LSVRRPSGQPVSLDSTWPVSGCAGSEKLMTNARQKQNSSQPPFTPPGPQPETGHVLVNG